MDLTTQRINQNINHVGKVLKQSRDRARAEKTLEGGEGGLSRGHSRQMWQDLYCVRVPKEGGGADRKTNAGLMSSRKALKP